MANNDKLRFLTGNINNLSEKSVSRGQVYFAINTSTNRGNIYFDAPIDADTTQRIQMSSDNALTAETADKAEKDSNGLVIASNYLTNVYVNDNIDLYKTIGDTTSSKIGSFLPIDSSGLLGVSYFHLVGSALLDTATIGDLLVNGNARFVNTILGNIQTADGWKTSRNFRVADNTSANLGSWVAVDGTNTSGYTLTLPATIKATLDGNASSTTKLANSRTIQTDLASIETASFDGTADITPGVTGILSIANGGTGNAIGSAVSADKWSTARNFRVSDNTNAHNGDWVSVDGSNINNYNLQLPETITASIIGHSSLDLALTGGTVTGAINLTAGSTTTTGSVTKQIGGTMANNNYWRIGVGATASDSGYVEFATADNGNEPIYIRQYTGAFTTLKRTLTLLDASGNTSIPGNLTVVGTGAFTGNLSTSGDLTTSGVLTANGSGHHSFGSGAYVWVQSTTDSTYSKFATAALVVEGGVSVAKQMSAKTVRIDNNSSGKGCTLTFDTDLNCLEFVFD